MARVATVNFLEEVDGDTFGTKAFNFFESDGTTPLDLSDATARVQVRKDSYTGRLMKTITSGAGLTWVLQTSGTFTIGGFDIDWGAGTYYYDIQMTYATSGIVRTYIRGKILVMDEATQNA